MYPEEDGLTDVHGVNPSAGVTRSEPQPSLVYLIDAYVHTYYGAETCDV